MTPRLQRTTFVVLVVACVLIAIASPVRIVIMGVLVLHALRGARQTLEAYAIGMLLLYLNTNVFGSLSLASTVRWPLIFAGFGRVVWDLMRERQGLIRHPAVPLVLVFSACAIFFAPIVSEFTQISIMKAVTFSVATFTILTAFSLTADQRQHWQDFFATIFTFIVLASLPYLVLPGGRFAGLFKGIINHPQALGTFLIPFTAWMSVVLIRAHHRSKLLTLATLTGWYFIYLSGSRTAFVATFGAVVLACTLGFLRGGEARALIGAGIRRLVVPALLVIVTVSALAGPRLVTAFKDFAFKGDEVGSYGEAFENSRGFFIQQQMANFRSSPLIGIGFAAPSESGDLQIKDSGFLGLPSGASVEKGFLPSAVLEETGLVGGTLTLLIFLVVLRGAFQQSDPALYALVLSALLINVGEMVFFSPTAAGMYMWLCIGLGTVRHVPVVEQRYAHRVVYRKPPKRLVSQAA